MANDIFPANAESELRRRLANLAPAKRALLEQKLLQLVQKAQGEAGNQADSGAEQVIPKRAGVAPPPLSFAQARLWFLDQYQSGGAFYNISWGYRLEGKLDIDALSAAFEAIVARHEALRTVFATMDREPVQNIKTAGEFRLKKIELGHLPADARLPEALRLAELDAAGPFDLDQGPLLRARLIVVDDDEYVLLVNVHHIVFDGSSRAIFDRELSALYAAHRPVAAAPPPALPELPIQYADYACWQRQWLTGEALATRLAYWKGQLAGAPALLELPTDRPRPQLQSFAGARERSVIDKTLIENLKALGQTARATLFMVLTAAFSVLLARYTRVEDIVIGSPIAGRNRQETENLIGFFVNTLALRIDLSGDPDFHELLGRVRATALAAYENQDVPFEKLVEELKPERSLAYSPLFQVMFVLQNTAQARLSLPNMRVHRLDLGNATSKFDLCLSATETGAGVELVFEYNSDLFDAATIVRMAGNFATLLASSAENPLHKVSRLSLLTEVERRQLIHDWNQTRADYPRDKTIQALFEEQVQLHPNNVALVGEGKTLTYAELNARANQLAHHLIALGAGPEILVAVFVERSIELIVALLAILKAGAAYLPLDPNYPKERLAFMLDDARASIVVTHAHLSDRLPEHGAKTVRVAGDSHSTAPWAELQAGNPAPRSSPDNLAYVIYTSGSTGLAKGVMIEQRALVNYACGASISYTVNAADRVLQFASISFDASAEEIYTSLTRGAALVLRSDEMLGAMARFLQLCEQWMITVAILPTAYWHELAAAIESQRLSLPRRLRLVVTGGEAALPERLRGWLRHAGAVRLINSYGPTEATIGATLWEAPVAAVDMRSVPIGRPIANYTCYILDPFQQPAPIGIAGELHIGGDGLARGYLNRVELTAEKFIRHPFSDDPKARLYKTGDLVRYRPDGTIEYLGRVDHQVKIRGFRIELGEIEAVLRQYPNVREALVIACEDEPGDKRVVAYVVLTPGSEANQAIGALRELLKQKLPDYMTPSAFVALDRMPMTPSGKLDRNALPAATPRGYAGETISPRNPLEARLAQLWKKLLNLESVGMTDNFFELGGHSLLIMRLIFEIEKMCGKRLSVAAVFGAPTIEQLAKKMTADAPLDDWISLLPINPGGSTPPLFSVHMGAASKLRDLGRHLGADTRFYGISSQCLDPKRVPLRTIEDMAAHNLREVRAVQPQGPYYLAGYCAAGVVAFEMAQQLTAQGEQVALLVMFDAPAPGLVADARRWVYTWRRHRRELAGLDLRQKGRYIWSRFMDRSRDAAERIAFRILAFYGMQVPHEVLSQYILDIHSRARGLYKPQVYSGKLTLIWAEQKGLTNPAIHLEGWKRLSRVDPENWPLPVSHQTMFDAAHVEALGKQLKILLSEARSTVNMSAAQDAPAIPAGPRTLA